MSNELAHYAFVPWLKEGINSKIAETDAQGVMTGTLALERAALDVNLTLESTDVNDSSTFETVVPKTVKLLGPPDVLAISVNAIVRTEPKANVNNYESNGLPYIEFYQESFLWTYTPASAGTAANKLGRLTPWLTLICLKDEEFTLKKTSDGRSVITIDSEKITDVFHDEKQHWAWAHVHLSTELTATTIPDMISEVQSELDANPDTGVCRLLCPRKLIKETKYTAFVVPTYETGRLSALGLSFAGVAAQKMSWGKTEDYDSKPQGYDYPVYYMWSFQTGANGDFESLARILKAVVMDPALGKRDMYIADAGYGIETTTPDSAVLGLEGALKPPDFVSDTWPNGNNDKAYRQHLRKLLNLSIDNEKRQTDKPDVIADSILENPFYSSTLGDDPIVTPSVYGRWHALVDRLKAGNNEPWVDTLNLDPRNRAAAGLGVTIVQKNQEDYMRRAWKQVEQVNKANEKIRRAALSKMVSNAIYRKHLQFASEDQSVRMTAPMHSFVLSSGKTAVATINSSIIPNASQSAAFKKITRPGKKSNKKINAVANPGANLIHKQVTQHFNTEVIKTAADKASPLLSVSLTSVSTAISSSVSNYQSSDTAMAQQALFDTMLPLTDFSHLESNAQKTTLNAAIDAYPDLSAAAKTLAHNAVDGITSSTQGNANTANVVVIEEGAHKAIFGEEITAKTYENLIISRNTGGAPGQLGRATLLQDITAFSDAVDGFNTDLISTMLPIVKAPALANLEGFSTCITNVLIPSQLITSRVKSTIILNVFNPVTKVYEQKELEDLQPIMAYPKFDDPMFSNLQALSQEYILPNIDKVPQNSITLMETNQVFIEAFMAGLNHEMSKELLWREYPTDQRGTYFRQFWDVVDNIRQTDPEKKYDITKMHTWKGELGDHSAQVKTSPDDSPYLVLLIRGELLKKYPNTQVYAQKAAFVDPAHPAAPRILSDANVEANILLPVFLATLEPDIYLFGFDLDKDEAKGDSSDASKPGWYFALRERPGQIRFGLDDYTPTDPDDPPLPAGDPANWNDLSWEHLVANKADLNNYQVDVNHHFTAGTGSENVPAASWGKNSADMAYILYQNPVLFARHGQEMLPD